jgi:hypothetical protein
MTQHNLLKINPRIQEIWEIVGVYEIYIESAPEKLKIKVIKIVTSDSEFPYMGVANLEVRGKGCGDHYRSLRNCSTKEEALQDAITGFFAFFSDEADIKIVEDW